MRQLDSAADCKDSYDVIIVGSGFAGIFFLKRALESGRVRSALVIERGEGRSLDWQIENQRNTADAFASERLIDQRRSKSKRWPFTAGLGGSSNCWWANAMRIHPLEFRLRSTYGVGVDWPIQYDELERFYCDAEEIMNISG